jgi:hypothetical protein
VATNADLQGQTVTASVSVGGLCENCPSTASASGEVARKPESRKVDEFGKLANDDVRLRLDGFFNELNADPTSKGYIIITATAKEGARLEKLMNNHISFRSFDSTKITIVTRDGAETNVQFWVVPAGADNPQ